MQHPKLYHMFKLDFVWDELTTKTVQQNADQNIEVLYMPKLNDAEITCRERITEEVTTLEKGWKIMKEKDEKNKAWFGTHIELKELKALDNTLKRIELWYKLNSHYDIQRCYGFKLNGINEPQYFFKGNGAWTALHAEDCGPDTFNVNIGPGISHWTLIHDSQIPKLYDAVKKELKLKTKVDLRTMRHRYYFSEKFLNKHGIEYEAVDHLPGYALYAPGYAYHQVVNRGYGLNVAWNVAIMSSQTLNEIMRAYEFETVEKKKVAMVPVLRIIHVLYFTHRHRLLKVDHISFPTYLKKHLVIEMTNYNRVQKKKVVEIQRVLRWEDKTGKIARGFSTAVLLCGVKTGMRDGCVGSVLISYH